MSYEAFRFIFYSGAILAGIMLIATILLFILLKIPTVFGDLTGSNARKAIENIRNQTESSDGTGYKPLKTNKAGVKSSDMMSLSGNLIRDDAPQGGMSSQKNITQKLSQGSNETTVLGANETTVLGANETTVLGTNAVPTPTPESAPIQSNPATITSNAPSKTESAVFQIEYEITFIHTNEIIA